MSILNNKILSTDSYKFSHWMQYPKGTTDVHSYISARGSRVKGCNETVFFGVQSYIKKNLLNPITRHDVEQAARFCAQHGTPFNVEGWMHIVNEHKGFFPVEIRAVPEGTVVPTGNALLTIHSTCPQCAWLVSYLETDLMRAAWYGSTVATLSRHVKKLIKFYMEKTCDNLDGLPFKLHDFGFRGVSSFESAGIGGAAHLVNFMGTDTVAGIGYAMEYYDSDVCGYSIPAAEHSTMTSWGREHEKDAYQNMVDAYAHPGTIFAVVSDSYDIYNAVKNLWADGLVQQVELKSSTVVIRPDSGNPTIVPIEVINLLMERVGYTTNSKGYKVLPKYVRVIQGDGLTYETIAALLENMEKAGLSVDNIAFGMGAGLLQKCDRDTFKFAMKCSAIELNQDGIVDVYKDPITDPGKKSLRGVLRLVKNKAGEFLTVREEELEAARNANFDSPELTDAMKTIYRYTNGHMLTDFTSFKEVRVRAEV